MRMGATFERGKPMSTRFIRRRTRMSANFKIGFESLETRALLAATLGPTVQVSGESPFIGMDEGNVAAQEGDNFI